jgi:hypothetical protein
MANFSIVIMENISNMANASLVSKVLERGPALVNSYTFIIFLRFLALFVSLLNASILANKKLKNSFYKYQFATAVADSLFSLLVLSSLVFNCPPAKCTTSTKVLMNHLAYILNSEYLSSCMAFFNILMEIFLTVQRIFAVRTSHVFWRSLRVKQVIFALLLVSFAYYSPVLFYNKIIPVEDFRLPSNSSYALLSTEFGKTRLAKLILISLTSIRISLVTVVLFILNLMAIVKFKTYFQNKLILKESTGIY